MSRASDEEIASVERALGVVFPDDYKRQLREEGPIDRLCGEAWLMLYPAHDLVDLNRAYDRSESHPGLVFIGSDGGGEGIAFDFRHAPPPVVLVNFVSAGWEDALSQAATFADFMAQRLEGKPYRFEATS